MEVRTTRRGCEHVPVVVLGAGAAGIAAALALGETSILIDQRSSVGGLAGTLERSGAIFDLGGHSFHTPHPAVRNLVFGSLEMFEQKREARCSVGDSLIAYPFQKHFRQLKDPLVVSDCERGLREADGGDGALNYESYLTRRFGLGIASHFLLPYNRKLWCGDLSRLSVEWARERVAAPEGIPEIFRERGGSRLPLQDDTLVAYPAIGGFGEIARALAEGVHDIRLGARVAEINIRRREIVMETGSSVRWDRLVSTLPITELFRVLPEGPANLRKDAASLERLPLRLFFVVIDRPVSTPIQRIYTCDPDSPVHKIVINHNSSDSLRALPRHGISGEMASSGWPQEREPALERRFVGHLRKLGLVRPDDRLVEISSLAVPYGYPVPTRDREGIISRLKGWLEGVGITTVGRFAEWAYINSDEAMHRGWVTGSALREAVA